MKTITFARLILLDASQAFVDEYFGNRDPGKLLAIHKSATNAKLFIHLKEARNWRLSRERAGLSKRILPLP